MSIVSVFAGILIFIGAIIVIFVRGIIKGQANKINMEEDSDFKDLLSMATLAFAIIGLGIVLAGIVMLYSAR